MSTATTAAAPRGGLLVDTAASLALCALALYGFHTVFVATSWVTPAAVGLAAGAGVAAATLRLRLPAPVGVGAAALVGIALSAVAALPQTAASGVLPTAATLTALGDGVVGGWRDLVTTLPPVGGGHDHLRIVPYLCGLVGGLATVTVAGRVRWAAPALLAPIALLSGVILLGTATPAGVWLQGAAFAAVALAWVALRHRRTRPLRTGQVASRQRSGRVSRRAGALALACVAAAGGAMLGPVLPGAGAHARYTIREHVVPPFDPSDYPSPLSGYRKFEVLNKDTVLFDVRGLPAGARIRIATMDAYDGVVWGVAAGHGRGTDVSGVFARVGARIPTDQRTAQATTATVTITVHGYSDVWLPDVGAVTAAHFGGPRADALEAGFRYNLATNVAVVPAGLRKGDTYTLDVAVPAAPPAQALAGRSPATVNLPAATGVPDKVNSVAQSWTAGTASASDRVAALVTKLHAGAFSDGSDQAAPSRPGHGAGRLNDFLNAAQLVGDAEQYTATMALAARSLGLPTRVVLGVAPGAATGGQVTGKDIQRLGGGRLRRPGLGRLRPHPAAQQQTRPAAATTSARQRRPAQTTTPTGRGTAGGATATGHHRPQRRHQRHPPRQLAAAQLGGRGTALRRPTGRRRSPVHRGDDRSQAAAATPARQRQPRRPRRRRLARTAGPLYRPGPANPTRHPPRNRTHPGRSTPRTTGHPAGRPGRRRRRRRLQPPATHPRTGSHLLAADAVHRHRRGRHPQPARPTARPTQPRLATPPHTATHPTVAAHPQPSGGSTAMRLTLSLQRPGTHPVDVAVTVEPGVPVGTLADTLARRLAARTGAPTPVTAFTLAVDEGRGQRVVPAEDPLVHSGIRSGAAVALVPVGQRFTAATPRPPVAVLRVLSGSEHPEYPLWDGTNTIGRDPSCTVQLVDALISKHHARINISSVVEIIDNNSANGVMVGGAPVNRAVLRGEDRVLLGDTLIAVRRLAAPAIRGDAVVPFTRSPRLDPHYDGPQLQTPPAPSPPARRRFPALALLAPLLVGAALFAFTRSPISLLFVLLSPMMLIGSYAEEAIGGRRGHTAAIAAYRTALASLDATLAAAADAETHARRAEHPATATLLSAAHELGTLLWCRRPDQDRFLDLRLGLGTRPSRTSLTLANQSDAAPAALLAEAADLLTRYHSVDAVPVVARLSDGAALGVAGPPAEARAVATGLICQLLTLHSPAELILTAATSSASQARWNWLKWLPHTNSPHTPLTGAHLADSPGAGDALIAELEALLATRSQQRDAPQAPAVVLLVEPDTAVNRARLVELAEHGGSHGIHVVWIAVAVAELPAACRTYLDVAPGAISGTVGYADTGERVEAVQLEPVGAADALALARRLAPVTDDGVALSDDSDLPSTVSFLAGDRLATALHPHSVLDRWQESAAATRRNARRDPSLRAVIGAAAGGDFALDLISDGPHALVGGTTGAGKSELLQAWILGMASAHGPERVTFLLVDYKGGSAFGECARLPHTVGLVTDLSPYLVRRALTSLNAELRRREEILGQLGAKDLAALETRRHNDPPALPVPPRLVIVVDEFAALVAEVPEFVDGVVNVAQRGRSLGLHLILATQRPAGVIKENLRANTNLRVALRMADEADSSDVIGNPQAAGFDPAIPGRAVAKTGPGRLTAFQAAYAGGWTSAEPPPPVIGVQELPFGPGEEWVDAADGPLIRTGPHDIERIVTTITRANDLAALPPPRRPWLPQLEPVIDLRALPATREGIVLGLLDDPDAQAQPGFAFNPDREGNLAVYGTGGTGKSTALRTVTIAAALNPDDPCHVYVLDFAGRAMAMLEHLPHVGAVISGDDQEGVKRLLDRLAALVDERERRYTRVDAATITQYRAQPDGDPDQARTLLVVDGLGAFRQAYELAPERAELFEKFITIAVSGRQVGVHVVVSADRPGSVPAKLASAIQSRLVLRLSEDNDYGALGVRADALTTQSPPGRGLRDGVEVQIAVLGGDAVTQAAHLRTAHTWLPLPRTAPWRIQRLADHVPLTDLPATVGHQPVLGLDWDLQPATFEARGSFLLAGPPGSGRSTALQTLCRALIRARPQTRLLYLGLPRSPLLSTMPWTEQAVLGEDISSWCTDLAKRISADAYGADPLALIVEGLPEYATNYSIEGAVQTLVKSCQAVGALLILEGETTGMRGGSPLHNLARSGRAGLILQPDQNDGQQILSVNFPRVRRNDFLAPGRGFQVHGGLTRIVQVAQPH